MKKITFGYSDSRSGLLFFLSWFAYFSTYICRLNFSAVMPQLLGDGGFSQSQVAAVSSVFFICYGAGQLFSGGLGDKLSPRKMIFWGVFISAVSNILIYLFYESYAALIILWAINGAVQSMVWSPILRIAGEYFSEKEKVKFGVDISTTVPLGTLASYGVSLVTLVVAPWRYVFLSCGVIVLAASLVWLFGTKNLIKPQKPVKNIADNNSATQAMPVKQLIKVLLSSGVILLLVSIAIQGTLKDSVTQWIPTFLESRYDTGTSVSLALTMLLPIINVTGAYFAKSLNKRLKNEMTTSVVFFGIAAALLAALLISDGKNMILSLLLMAGVTNCMFAINVLLITLVPLRFSSMGRTSTVGGFLNAMAYIGCGVLNMGAGALLEKSGSSWVSLFVLWLSLAAGASVITLICCVPWKKFLKSNEKSVYNGDKSNAK